MAQVIWLTQLVWPLQDHLPCVSHDFFKHCTPNSSQTWSMGLRSGLFMGSPATLSVAKNYLVIAAECGWVLSQIKVTFGSWNWLKCLIVLRVQPKCCDTTVADILQWLGFIHHYLVLVFFNTISLSCHGFWKSLKSDTDTGNGYKPHKAHMQNNLIEFLRECIVH